MSPTRRQVIVGAAAGALGAAGVYELVDRLAASPPRRPPVAAAPPEQHLLEGVRVVHDNGVEVLVPPLHHAVVTGHVHLEPGELASAQAALERTLAGLEADYAPSPAGLGITVGWGLPYFERLVPAAAARMLPFDRRAGKPALLPARRFPSDPPNTVLERNDLAVQLRSDVLAHIADAVARIEGTGAFRVTSLRRGFVGGGFEGGVSLPRAMAMAANVTGAELIPEHSELFLGFTSSQKAAVGPGKIANLETLGYVDLRGSEYFREGTHMHLSHIVQDIETWYVNFLYAERVATAFRPGLEVPEGTQTIPQGPDQVTDAAAVRSTFNATGAIGHSGAIQATSRLEADVVGPDGTRYPKGTAVPIRADFNSLDNPFAYSDQPAEMGNPAVAALHFVVFNPTSDDFERNRLAMDGVLPDGSLGMVPRSRAQGFNSVLTTTHRQNFLVPPRRNRSFPLVGV